MRKILGILILLFVIITLVNYRFCCSNNGTPEVTDKKSETIYSSSLATDPSYSFIEYSLYDTNRTCTLWGDEIFLTFKKSVPVIERDDECEHCKRAWKWHYNK